MKSRRSQVCPSAPRSWTSIFASAALTVSLLAALPAPRVHLQVRIFAQATDLHEGRPVPKPQALLGPTIRPPRPSVDDQRLQLVSRAAAAERLSEIDPLLRVEAEIPHAVGGEAAPVAARAERFGRRRDGAEDRAVG